MNSKLQNLYDELERQRAEILTLVVSLSPDQFNQPPSPNKWSIAQILTHLLTSEQLSISYMKKKSLGINDLRNSGLFTALQSFVLKLSQRIPVKYRAPKVIVERTPKTLNKEEILLKWREIRDELKQLLESIQEKDVKKLIYKHPFAGRLNVGQAVIFLREHTAHHLPQIKRLL